MRAPAVWIVAGLALATLSEPGSATAHTRSLSYSSWTWTDDGAHVLVRIPRLELTRVAGLDATGRNDGPLGQYLAERLALRVGPYPCRLSNAPTQRAAAEGWVAFRWRVICPSDQVPTTLVSWILRSEAPSHLHFARLELEDGAVVERVLSSSDPTWHLQGTGTEAAPADAPSGSTLGRYLLLGIEHILTGWDHLAFVIALLLLAGTLGEVARLVTGFTIAHSVTLALAVLGLVHPEAQAVEAVIGFSVALVGVENGWVLAGRGRALPWIVTAGLSLATLLAVAGAGTLSAMTLAGLTIFTASHFALLSRAERPARWRAVLAFAFGLVHGFGFAGVLSEMTLPTARLAPALFGFNLGVEIGQLGVVLLVWPLLQVLARRRGDRARRLTAEFASAAIFCIGLVWFLTRAF